MRGKWLALPVGAVCLGAGVGALSWRWRPPAATAVKAPAGAVSAPNPEVTGTGKIRPQHIVRVTAPGAGPVEAFLADAGQEVYQGEVLARVGAAGLASARDAAAQAVEHARDAVAKAEAMIVSSRQEASRAGTDAQRAQVALDRDRKAYDRQSMLHEAGATPRLVYEKAQKDYAASQREYAAVQKAAQAASGAADAADAGLAAARTELADRTAELESAQLALAAAEVRSPVDGFLFARNGEVGKPARGPEGPAGDSLFEIATDIGALEVPVVAPPEALRRIRTGQAAVVVVAEVHSDGIAGVVREIKDRQAVVEFTSTAPAIKPGMQAAVRIKIE